MNADASERHFLTDSGTLRVPGDLVEGWAADRLRSLGTGRDQCDSPGRLGGGRDLGDERRWHGRDPAGPRPRPDVLADGERILFYRDDDPGVYVMSSRDGTGVTKLIDGHAMVDWQAVTP